MSLKYLGLWLFTGFLMCLGLLVPGANAHEIRPGLLEITQNAPGDYETVFKNPIRLGQPLAVTPQYPAQCTLQGQPELKAIGTALISKQALKCQGDLAGSRIGFTGLESTLTDIIVRFADSDGQTQTLRASPETPEVLIARAPSRWTVAHTYFVLGVEHILLGIDHLLFVLALVLLIEGRWRLVKTITAFTIAHSVTLAGTSLGFLSLPPRPVEAVIALSIVFLAVELALSRRDGKRLSERVPWVIAFVFGLLHGFGFAGALAEIGLPQGEVPMALLTFNLGVEAGQLAFVFAVLAVLWAVTKCIPRLYIDKLASYGIGIMASFWLIERLI